MDKEQLIQDYIANKLSAEDKIKVEAMLKSDADFKSEFDNHKDVSMAFKIYEANKLKAHFNQLEDNTPKEKSLFQKFKYAYLAIASIVLIGVFYSTFSTQSGNDLFNSNFDIYPNTYQPVTRSSETNKNNDAFIAYENGDFSTAEKEFKLLLNASENANIRFYYGISLLNQSKENLALNEFNKLNTIAFNYRAESLWYSALIHIKNEDYEKAKANLNDMNRFNLSFKAEERKLLLEELENK